MHNRVSFPWVNRLICWGMRGEVFWPVAFISALDKAEEVLSRAANHKYGLRAAVFGGRKPCGYQSA